MAVPAVLMHHDSTRLCLASEHGAYLLHTRAQPLNLVTWQPGILKGLARLRSKLQGISVLGPQHVCVQVFFAATGVSDGDLLRGVRYFSGGASTNSIVMRASSGTGDSLSMMHLQWCSGAGYPALPSGACMQLSIGTGNRIGYGSNQNQAYLKLCVCSANH